MLSSEIKIQKAHSPIDGWLYDKLISPMAVWLEDMILSLVDQGSSVLEIGCGPGSLACRMAQKCQNVVAIDISEKMISYAKSRKNRLHLNNLEFIAATAGQLSTMTLKPFGFSVVSFCLHEMEPAQRQAVLKDCLRYTDKMIIADYRAPFPQSLNAAGNRFLEILAGRTHHRHFLDWQSHGGIDGFIQQCGVAINKELEWPDGCGKTVVVSGSLRS
jgi:SAM-dependent methyltransferase